MMKFLFDLINFILIPILEIIDKIPNFLILCTEKLLGIKLAFCEISSFQTIIQLAITAWIALIVLNSSYYYIKDFYSRNIGVKLANIAIKFNSDLKDKSKVDGKNQEVLIGIGQLYSFLLHIIEENKSDKNETKKELAGKIYKCAIEYIDWNIKIYTSTKKIAEKVYKFAERYLPKIYLISILYSGILLLFISFYNAGQFNLIENIPIKHCYLFLGSPSPDSISFISFYSSISILNSFTILLLILGLILSPLLSYLAKKIHPKFESSHFSSITVVSVIVIFYFFTIYTCISTNIVAPDLILKILDSNNIRNISLTALSLTLLPLIIHFSIIIFTFLFTLLLKLTSNVFINVILFFKNGFTRPQKALKEAFRHPEIADWQAKWNTATNNIIEFDNHIKDNEFGPEAE